MAEDSPAERAWREYRDGPARNDSTTLQTAKLVAERIRDGKA
ncbi:hypothetical protein [Microbacterium sp.]|nr:hypothetical protein [Microbacterium sp.]